MGSLGPATQACHRQDSDIKWLLLHMLCLVYGTLTLELSSRCQVKSFPVNLHGYLDLTDFTNGNQILDIQKVPVVLISTMVTGLGFYFVLRHCEAEKDFLPLTWKWMWKRALLPLLIIHTASPPSSMYNCACFRDCWWYCVNFYDLSYVQTLFNEDFLFF